MKIIKKISIVFSLILSFISCDDTYSPPSEIEKKVYTLNLDLNNFPESLPIDIENLRYCLWGSKKGDNKQILLKSFIFLKGDSGIINTGNYFTITQK